MRIIGGKWRSRRLSFPRWGRTRPMPDRIRESIFDILASRFGLCGTLPSLKVADLFAGSGSMGWEAVSRGASGCDFIEKGALLSFELLHLFFCQRLEIFVGGVVGQYLLGLFNTSPRFFV